jgi:hypothetical protein
MPNRRNPQAAMSPIEVNALRRAASGLAVLISTQHKDLLIRMQLARVNEEARLEITEAGKQRLAADGNPGDGA